MTLTRLSTELFENIITHVLPEGSERVALTWRKVYALCTPFNEPHNILRSRVHNFTY